MAALFLVALLASATAAFAQTDRFQNIGSELDPTCQAPGTAGSEALKNETLEAIGAPTGVETSCDSSFTPIAKGNELWEQIAGARFGQADVIDGSATSFDAELNTVAFRNTKFGFFGGSVCDEPPVRISGEGASAYAERVSRCESEDGELGERVPVIYAYTERDGEGPKIEELWRGGQDDRGGYVGAIAWIDDKTALAVGGDGYYPRREPVREGGAAPSESDADYAGRQERGDRENAAGMARAWIFEGNAQTKRGAWRELTDLPAEMRGLSSLGLIHPGESLHANGELAPPGGWGFAGAFGQIWEWKGARFLPEPEETRFRVTGFAFQLSHSESAPPRIAAAGPWATTAGCCALDPTQNYGRILKRSADGTWTEIENADVPGRVRPQSLSAFGPNGAVIFNPDGAVPPPSDPLYPEPASYVGVYWPGYLGTSAQQEQDQFLNNRRNAAFPETRRLTSNTFRLTAVDDNGKFVIGQNPNLTWTRFNGQGTWAVGALSSGQAAVQQDLTKDSAERSRLYRLSSYSLNAIDVVNTTESIWAAGRHGALLRFGAGGTLPTGEPPGPRLGKPKAESLAEKSGYADASPELAGEVGDVPPLGEKGFQTLSTPELRIASTPDLQDVPTAVVMSRDGSEGWATTKSGALYRYDGLIWSRCDPDGVPAQAIPPDRACAGFEGEVLTATRVPYEYDSDPTNDDRFEVAAVVELSAPPPNGGVGKIAVYRYKFGHWEAMPGKPLDHGSSDAVSIAFTGPDEGWLIGGLTNKPGNQISLQFARFYRFDGQTQSWMDCMSPSRPATRFVECADRGLRLPEGTVESRVTNRRGIRIFTADQRVYLYGTRTRRQQADVPNAPPPTRWPLIIYRDSHLPCTVADRRGCWRGGADADGDAVYDPADGGYDPGCASLDPLNECVPHGDSNAQGGVKLFTAQPVGDPGRFEGWVTGIGSAQRLRLQSDGRFEPWSEPNDSPASDYGFSDRLAGPGERLVVMPGQASSQAYAVSAAMSHGHGPLLSFDADEGRWGLVPTPFPAKYTGTSAAKAIIRNLTPDNAGGLFAAVTPASSRETKIYQYTSRVPVESFEDVAHPVRERVSAAAGGADGSFWIATKSNVLYRYDRVLGWERAPIPGWDPGSIQARGSPVNGLAVGDDGVGVAVGPGGRIANLSPAEIKLDAAAGAPVCGAVPAPPPPCGTGRDLQAAAVASDGSALVGGDELALLWRPPGGEFRTTERPPAALSARITSISMPAPDTAYLTTDTGEVHRGQLADGSWSWRVENTNAAGNLTTRVSERKVLPLESVAVDENGHGYAAGAGVLYERAPGEAHPWKQVVMQFPINSVALPHGEGSGALFAGPQGLLVTRYQGRFEIARLPDPYDPINGVRNSAVEDGGSSVAGMALLPGTESGDVEAWVALSRPPTPEAPGSNDALLHFASDPTDPLLDPLARGAPLADAPRPRPGELSFAAFGKSDCLTVDPRALPCVEITGTNLHNELLATRIAEEIESQAQAPGGPKFALFTGDVSSAAGAAANKTVASPFDPALELRRWRELIVGKLNDRGIPLFAAIGQRDLSGTEICDVPLPQRCHGTRLLGTVGPNLGWRQAFDAEPAPWGSGEPASASGGAAAFEPAPDDPLVLEPDDVTVEDPSGFIRDSTVSLRGARTHYAIDAVDTNGDQLARIVVVDNSLRSLAASDPLQNPLEPNGGQAAWLERMLCESDAATASTHGCSREQGVPAIVLANTPSYSYGPGTVAANSAGRTADATAGETQVDATLFESVLMKNKASVAVFGRIGWNALYWTTAPGIHEPCPGDDYPEPGEVPPPGTRLCGQSTGEDPTSSAREGAQQALDAAERQSLDIPPQAGDAVGASSSLISVLPNVIAASAGGSLATAQGGDASDGFWHGYTIVRLSRDGDPTETVAEQRPVFDWIGVSASEHELKPRERVRIEGFGREPPALDANFRYNDIDTAAITHRYELVEADQKEPWLPKLDSGVERDSLRPEQTRLSEDPCGPYICLDPKIGTIEDQSGVVKAGNGKYPDSFAIALLSVGNRSVTWPIIFKRSPSFVVGPTPGSAAIPSVPSTSGKAPPPPPPPTPSQPNVPGASAPSIPAPPPLAPLSVSQSPEPQPPAPPAPPPPTEPPSGLSLALAPPSIAIATPTAVIQPPTPPVNPAPPGGARREARQRQAATQKSGADSETGAESQDGGVDLVQSPGAHGSAMTRRERGRPEPSFTAIAQAEQPSAWAQAALYSGGIVLIAAGLSAGWSRGRPTPRRRPPLAPAPARAVATKRRA